MTASPTLVDAAGQPLVRARPRPVAGFLRGRSNGYRGADATIPEFATWWPALLSADQALLWDRDELVARARDLIRNNGWATGLVERECDSVIGNGLRLNMMLDWRALGLDLDQARALADRIEALYRAWSEDPRKLADAQRRNSWGEIQRIAYGNFFGADGEALGVLKIDTGRPMATTVQLIDPDRLSNPDGRPDDRNFRGGIEMTADGVAHTYHIRNAHPSDSFLGSALEAVTWTAVPREALGFWPRVVHAVWSRRPDQTRGIGALASVLVQFRMLDRYQAHELQAAVLNAAIAATVETNLGPEGATSLFAGESDIEAYAGTRAGFYGDRGVTIAGARAVNLFPGDKLNFTSPTRPNANFAPFESAMLRHIAGATGLTYEQVAADWSKTNYSSARAALIEFWRSASARRQRFVEGFMRPVLLALVMEWTDRGLLDLPEGVPDVFDAPAAWTRARWVGPPRGWVDPAKEAQAAQIRMENGLTTLDAECADQGVDWEEVLEQRAREIERMRELGLPAPGPVQVDPRSQDEADALSNRQGVPA